METEDAGWRKSSKSYGNGDCVELAPLPDGGVAFRNSRHPAGPVLEYTAGEWAAFSAGMKAGEFDDLIVGMGRVQGRRHGRGVR
jgi:hypothetical protein